MREEDMGEEEFAEEIIMLLKDSGIGMSITDLADKGSASRTKVRIMLAFLFGRGVVGFRQVGMAKVFYLLGEQGEGLKLQKS